MKEVVEKFEGQFECLRENTEKYITFSVPIKEELESGKATTYRIKFIDSFRFMQTNFVCKVIFLQSHLLPLLLYWYLSLLLLYLYCFFVCADQADFFYLFCFSIHFSFPSRQVRFLVNNRKHSLSCIPFFFELFLYLLFCTCTTFKALENEQWSKLRDNSNVIVSKIILRGNIF